MQKVGVITYTFAIIVNTNMTKKQIKQGNTIKTCRDENCPKCDYPETIVIREEKTMKPLRIICGSRKCDYCKFIKDR